MKILFAAMAWSFLATCSALAVFLFLQYWVGVQLSDTNREGLLFLVYCAFIMGTFALCGLHDDKTFNIVKPFEKNDRLKQDL